MAKKYGSGSHFGPEAFPFGGGQLPRVGAQHCCARAELHRLLRWVRVPGAPDVDFTSGSFVYARGPRASPLVADAQARHLFTYSERENRVYFLQL